MSWLEAVVLGLVQGLTEFLPISSSAHLRVVGEAFGWGDPGAAFTAITQIGTEAAVLLYFRRDIGRIVRAWVLSLGNRSRRRDPDARMGWLIIVGSLPIVVLGLLFQDQIETTFRDLRIVAIALVAFSLILYWADRVGTRKRELGDLTVGHGIAFGFAQALAIVPGVSRSGGTISAGLLLGLTRPAAVRYSFLLAIPAVVAAGLFQIPDVFTAGGPGLTPSVAQMVIATLLAFGVGYASIAWLLRYVERHSVYLFVWYRLALGTAVLVLLATGTISAT